MSAHDWEALLVLHDTVSAQAFLERLRSEGIGARLRTDTAILGAARRCRIEVPAQQLAKARSVLEAAQFSDEELDELALRSPREDGESS